MTVLLTGMDSAKGMVGYYERALRRHVPVRFAGVSSSLERAGYAPDLDISHASDIDWSLHVEEWRPTFPTGMERSRFTTSMISPDACFDVPLRSLMAPFFDHVFVNQHDTAARLAAEHPSVHYSPFAYDPAWIPARPDLDRDLDVAFIGAPYPERLAMLRRLERSYKLNDYLISFERTTPEHIGEVYSRAKIVINTRPAGLNDHNPRVFEAMGCGALVLSPELPGPDPLFRAGEHLVTYRSLDDIPRLVEELLADDPRRARIAAAGQAEVMRAHLYEHRVTHMLSVIKASERREAPARGWSRDDLFLGYQRVFGRLMMLSSMADLYGRPGPSRAARLRGLPLVATALGRRARRLGWRYLKDPVAS